MHILIISDAYPPMRTSCATQIYDLAQALIGQGHQVSIIIPAHSQKKSVEVSNSDGPTVYSVRCLKTKDVGYARRTFAEFINPFAIRIRLALHKQFLSKKFNGIVWYSPTIFWGPLVKWLKLKFNCKSYLILRDIFPDWARDLGLIKNNLVLFLLQRVAKLQYLNADVIGTQSPNNYLYLSKKLHNFPKNIEVLWNWSGPACYTPCSIDLSKTKLQGKLCFVYAGNLGVAQGTDQIITLLRVASKYKNIGFLFVGRGSEKLALINRCKSENINNVLFYDEIKPSEVHDLYAQCHVGLVILDPSHTTHNIPGKFISYLQGGLKIFALVNSGNDLIELINREKLGFSASGVDSSELDQLLAGLIKDIDLDDNFRSKSRNYFLSHFTSDKAAMQIVNSFKL